MARRQDQANNHSRNQAETVGWKGSRTRREFFTDSARQMTVLASSAAVLALIRGCSSDSSNPTSPQLTGGQIQIDISQSQYSALGAVGGMLALGSGAMAGMPANGLLLIRASDSTVLALSRVCTHEGCQVGAFNGGIAECPCHGARFDTSGNVVRGPATRALGKYTATLTGNIVTINT